MTIALVSLGRARRNANRAIVAGVARATGRRTGSGRVMYRIRFARPWRSIWVSQLSHTRG
jgi:hypothetical protein